jgi:TonB family protein
MPNTLLRLAVALVAFGLGVTATTLWIAYRTSEVKSVKFESVRKRECKVGPILPLSDELPQPHLDEPPLPPLPPLPTIEAPPPAPPLVPVSGDGLERKILSKPLPIYPPIAKAARAFGMVRVHVVVDEEGKVTSAKAISGHPLLQSAAVQAAYQARLAPAVLGGEAIKLSGTLSYNFVLP